MLQKGKWSILLFQLQPLMYLCFQSIMLALAITAPPPHFLYFLLAFYLLALLLAPYPALTPKFSIRYSTRALMPPLAPRYWPP